MPRPVEPSPVRPAALVAVPLLAGMALAGHRPDHAAWLGATALAVLGAALLSRVTVSRSTCDVLLGSATALAAVLAGALHATAGGGAGSLSGLRAGRVLAAWLDRPVQVTGTVVGLVQGPDAKGRVRLQLDLEEVSLGRIPQRLRGRVDLSAPPESAPILRRAGRIRAWVRLRDAAPPCPRILEAEPAAGRLSGRITSTVLVEILGPPGVLRRLREHVGERLAAAFPARTRGAGLARALVLGARDGIDPEYAEGFRAAGTAHILSVSGLHVALVAWMAVAVLVACSVPWPRAIGAAAAGACFLALLAGGDPPVVRAAAAVVALAMAASLGRPTDAWNLLALAGVVAAWATPDDAWRLPSVLSFAAAASMLLLFAPLRRALPGGRRPVLHACRDGVAASLAASLGLLPLCATWFHRLQLFSPAFNLVAVPVAGVATAASLATAAVACVRPGWAWPLAWLVEACARTLAACDAPAGLVDHRVVTPSVWTCVMLAGGLLALRWAGDPRLRALGGVLVLAGIACVARPRDPGVAGGGAASLEVVDVGQGSAAIVEIGRRAGRTFRVVVDAGGWAGSDVDVGERRVAEALWRRRIERVDAVVVTHADFDHRGGAPAVIRLFRPSLVMLAPAGGRVEPEYAAIMAAADEAGARVVRAARGSELGPVEGGPRLVVAWPPREPGSRRGLSDNDGGLALVLEDASGAPWALIPGDQESVGEMGLVAAGLGDVPVLVAAHHGSRTSTSRVLLDALRPRTVIISAGRSNAFGHPHREVLDRLAARGLVPWLTADAGDVLVTFAGGLARTSACGCERGDVVGAASRHGPPATE